MGTKIIRDTQIQMVQTHITTDPDTAMDTKTLMQVAQMEVLPGQQKPEVQKLPTMIRLLTMFFTITDFI